MKVRVLLFTVLLGSFIFALHSSGALLNFPPTITLTAVTSTSVG